MGHTHGKIHNFCIDKTDTSILPATAVDQCRMITQTRGFVSLEQVVGGEDNDGLVADNSGFNNNIDNEMAEDNAAVPTELLGAGEHYEDVSQEKRQEQRRKYKGMRLPRELLSEDIVLENNYQRPRPRGTK